MSKRSNEPDLEEIYRAALDQQVGRNRKEIAENLREMGRIIGDETLISPDMIAAFLEGDVQLSAGRPRKDAEAKKQPHPLEHLAAEYDKLRAAQPKGRANDQMAEIAARENVLFERLHNYIRRRGRKHNLHK